MTYVGIDVSKVTFVVAYSSVKTNKTRTFKNTVNGVHEFVQTISASEHNCVLEATGNYSALLVYLLSEAGITISLENPLKIKNFARVMLTVTKTDEIDARLIALYGEKMQPAPYKLRSDAILVLKQKRTVLRQLKKQLVATRNLKGSMEVLPFFDPKCKKTIEKTITFLEKQIKEMEEELTRNRGYRKDSKDIRIPSFVYRKYPKLREALSRRCAVYNEQLEMVERMEDEGQIIVIRPLKPVAVDRIEKDVQKLTEFYQEGYECARALLEE